jgi:hypothetical protein
MTTTSDVAVRGPETAVAQITLETQLAYATEIAKSGLIPKDFQKRPENVLVAIEWGRELGLSPIASLNEIYVVHGSPSLSAKSMLTLARRAGHRVRVTSEPESATCEIVRADDPDFPHTVTYTLDDARRAGLMTNSGWKNTPATMLRWRAVANAVRLACPEVLGGVSFLPEEVEEIRQRNAAQSSTTVTQVVPDIPLAPSKSASDYMKVLKLTGTAMKAFVGRLLGRKDQPSWPDLTDAEQRTVLDGLARWESTGVDPTTGETRDQPAPAPQAPEAASAEVVDAEIVEPQTDEARTKLTTYIMRQFGGLGIKDREDRLRWTGAIVGHPVLSTNELPMDELSFLADEVGQVRDARGLQARIDQRLIDEEISHG